MITFKQYLNEEQDVPLLFRAVEKLLKRGEVVRVDAHLTISALISHTVGNIKRLELLPKHVGITVIASDSVDPVPIEMFFPVRRFDAELELIRDAHGWILRDGPNRDLQAELDQYDARSVFSPLRKRD